MNQYLKKLHTRESQAMTDVMAFMSYNPSIGRVLEKGGVKKFGPLMRSLTRRLKRISSRNEFDELHHEYIDLIINSYKTNNGRRLSYGQAQKPLNVFLKVYIDWARKPDDQTREKLIKYLHVPLDSILMKAIKREYAHWYRVTMKPLIKYRAQEYSLSKIDQILYLQWQAFFRRTNPTKPLIFDVAWAIER